MTDVAEPLSDFESFVAPHTRAMWVLAVRLAGRSAAEDVVQEALLTAWRRRSTFDAGRGTPRAWLLVLVADRCRKHWRSARPTVELVDVPVAVDLESHLDVSRAVATLPRRQRLAVELFYVLDLPVAECALVMGCSVATVTSTLVDARRALRTKLEVEP